MTDANLLKVKMISSCSLEEEMIYSKQYLHDKVTDSVGILVYRWILTTGATHDLHIQRNSILFTYLIEKTDKLFNVVFVCGDLLGYTEEFEIQKNVDKGKCIVVISCDSIEETPSELIYRNCKGKFLNNFDVFKYTGRRV